MSEVKDAVQFGGAYKESDEHVPDPTDAYGTLDTSGTAGAAHGRIEKVTPIFEVAKAQDKITAARALDPDDNGVHESMVVLPQGMVIAEDGAEAARQRVKDAAENLEPVVVGGPNEFQEQAAESGTEGAETAQEQQQSQEGSAGTTQVGTDTERQTGGEDPATVTGEAPHKATRRTTAKPE